MLQLALEVFNLVHPVLVDLSVISCNLPEAIIKLFDLVCKSRNFLFLQQVFGLDLLHFLNIFFLSFHNFDSKMCLILSLKVLLLLKHLLLILFGLLFANYDLTFELNGLLLLLRHHFGDLLFEELVVLHV